MGVPQAQCFNRSAVPFFVIGPGFCRIASATPPGQRKKFDMTPGPIAHWAGCAIMNRGITKARQSRRVFMNSLWLLVGITALAGMGGTGMGGLVACLFRKDSKEPVS